ncbi:DUF4173 domain-containing protein [Pilimelia columellifera subsp. columellifera]|uniref:DUF4173 domain-containing protein n=2 Tax=Pilimelia TaxID=53370 RepID=A0ABP6AG21_9ACTN
MPPRPGFVARHWPAPTRSGSLALPAAIGVSAVLAALFVPLTASGVGWLLGGAGIVGAVAVATRSIGTDLPARERLIRAGWAAAALALLSVLTFRNAWWLVTFCVFGALGCAIMATVGGRSARAIMFGLIGAPVATARCQAWVARSLVRVSRESGAQVATARRLTLSVGLSMLVLLVFGSLLASADAAFGEVLFAIVPEIGFGSVVSGVFLFLVGGFMAGGIMFGLASPPDLSGWEGSATNQVGRTTWALPIGTLVVLFGAFVAVQLTALFGGREHLLRTAGLSAAEYARSGFWQLMIVTILTLAVVLAVTRWAKQAPGPDRRLLRVLLGPLCVLSVVIVLSALSRMYTYQRAYSFTGERIFVMSVELLLGLVFLMILAAGVAWRGAWVPRAVVGLLVAMLLGLAWINPEGFAARANVARYQDTGKIDLWYLRALSADATPALAKLPPEMRACALSWISEELRGEDRWHEWNLGRARARAALRKVGPLTGQGCRDASRYDDSGRGRLTPAAPN